MNLRILAHLVLGAAMLSACGGQTVGPAATTATLATAPETASSTLAPAPTQTAAPTQTTIPTATSIPTQIPAPSSTPAATASPDATATPADTEEEPAATIKLEPVAEGFTRPLYVTSAGDGSSRLFVVEQAGVVRIVRDGTVSEQPFLDITSQVGSSGNEQGLLSIAFHPKYAENGYLFVDYTNTDGDTVISRFQASGDSADPASEQVLLEINQPYSNHNGGLVKFGPDGYLYIGMGDGGSAGDPQNRAQDRDELLGKILRIDVDSAAPYGIPADNPYANGGGKPEIWASGVRNPWRFSFDRATGDMFIGDVGQNQYEEINYQPAGQANLNYGWRVMEGQHCYKADDCDQEAYQAPVAEYEHAQGCSVTGGYMYQGAAFPQLVGKYYYADYCQGTIWELQRSGDGWNTTIALKSDLRISSFGEDQQGELYVVDGAGGAIYRLVASNA